MADKKKETTQLSFDSNDRALALLKSFIRSRYFSEFLPNSAELSRLLRIPKTSIDFSLRCFESEGLIVPRPKNGGYDYVNAANPSNGFVIFAVNRDILKGWYSLILDWMIGVEQVLFEEGYDLRIYSGFQTAEEKILKISEARSNGCMGVVLPNYVEPSVIQHVSENNIPAVILGNATINQEELGCICSDNKAGIEKLVSFLKSENHTQIAMYVTGINSHDGYRERFIAYQQCMRQNGLESWLELVFYDSHNQKMAGRAAEIFYGLPTKPSAIICGSDREAFELIAELHHLKIEVPNHVSIVGFDNNHFGRMLNPPMTTIDIFSTQMGRVAANYLLNEMQSPQLPIKMLLPTELTIRRSTQKRLL